MTMNHHRLWPKRTALLAATALLLGACGSTSGSDADGIASRSEAAETTTTLAAETTTTVAPPIEDVAAYCALAIENAEASNAFTAFDDPVAVEAFFDAAAARAEAARLVVPAEIAASFEVVYQQQLAVVAAAEAVGFDVTLLVQSDIETPESLAAEADVDAFRNEVCGYVEPEPEVTEEEASALESELGMTEEEIAAVAALLETETGRALMAEGMMEGTELTLEQATCLVENGDMVGLMMLGSGLADVDSELMSNLFQTLDLCGIPLDAIG